jgi:pimeloyl-ACP methyl ester carboxylesterase
MALTLVLPATATAAPLKKCEKRSPVQCGSVTVPLDRSGAVAGSVELSVARVPARKEPAAGTVMLIAGGPGESARDALAFTGQGLSKALLRFDVVAFDQRGTGESGRLRCRALSRRGARRALPAAFARCAAQLGPQRAFYRTTDSVDDVEAVRAYLGAPALSLIAVSYGARVAGEYARRYPATTARLVLDSPVTLAGSDPFARQTQASLPRVLSALCAGRSCPFTKAPYRDLTRLARRLSSRPLRGRVFDRRGRSRRAALSAHLLHALVAASDSDPFLRGQLPAGIVSALRGDAAPLLRLAAGASGASGALSIPLTAATLCAESPLPWDVAQPPGAQRDAALDAALAGLGTRPFAPFAPRTVVTDGLTSICRRWPAVPNRPAPVGGSSAVPALVLSGTEDLRTPLEQARAVASGYSSASVLAVPQTGHSVIGSALRPCATRAVVRFLRGHPAPSSCPARRRRGLSAIAKPPPVRLSDVPGRSAALRARRAGRLTIRDALGQLLSRGLRVGGLRGGSARIERRRIVLEGYEYISGVAVSGQLEPGEGGEASGAVDVWVGGSVLARVEL